VATIFNSHCQQRRNIHGVGKIYDIRLKSPFLSETVQGPFLLWNINRKSYRWRIDPCRFRWPDLEWPWKAGREGPFYQANLSNNARTVWPRTTKFDKITHVGEGRICLGAATPLPQAAVPQRSPILGVIFQVCIHPLTQNYQIRSGNTCGEGACFCDQSHPYPKGAGSQRSKLFSGAGRSFIFMRNRS